MFPHSKLIEVKKCLDNFQEDKKVWISSKVINNAQKRQIKTITNKEKFNFLVYEEFSRRKMHFTRKRYHKICSFKNYKYNC